MAIYDGHISLGEDRVHVILGFEEEKVTMSSNGREIGIWGPEEISIRYLGNGRYAISAEDETLEFEPNDQDLFAIQFGEIDDTTRDGRVDQINGRHSREQVAQIYQEPDRLLDSAPPPRPVTRVAFYGLAAVTSLLGMWAALSLILG